MVSCESARAVPGRGLEGDSFFEKDAWEPGREITLIEMEKVREFEEECGSSFTAKDSRRNVVTTGVSLNDLVDREFHVGDVKLLGVKLCQPCSHLEQLLELPVRKGLWDKGGLRAQILTEGVIHVGDSVES
jgi:MOSC domain-containing protein YiiM